MTLHGYSGGSGGGNLTVDAATFASTVTPQMPADGNLWLDVDTLTGPMTLANPTVAGGGSAPKNRSMLWVYTIQDGTGGRTISYGSAYNFGTDTPSSLDDTNAGEAQVRNFVYNAATGKYDALGLVRGL